MLKVYCISAFQSAPAVRALHDRLRMAGHEPVSSWAEGAHGAESLEALSTAECRAIWTQNDRDMRSADVVIVFADTPCREGWMEAQRALDMGTRVVCVGRPTLTMRAFGFRVRTVASVDAALEVLRG